MVDPEWGINAPPSLSGRAIATSFDRNTVQLVRPKINLYHNS